LSFEFFYWAFFRLLLCGMREGGLDRCHFIIFILLLILFTELLGVWRFPNVDLYI